MFDYEIIAVAGLYLRNFGLWRMRWTRPPASPSSRAAMAWHRTCRYRWRRLMLEGNPWRYPGTMTPREIAQCDRRRTASANWSASQAQNPRGRDLEGGARPIALRKADLACAIAAEGGAMSVVAETPGVSRSNLRAGLTGSATPSSD